MFNAKIIGRPKINCFHMLKLAGVFAWCAYMYSYLRQWTIFTPRFKIIAIQAQHSLEPRRTIAIECLLLGFSYSNTFRCVYILSLPRVLAGSKRFYDIISNVKALPFRLRLFFWVHKDSTCINISAGVYKHIELYTCSIRSEHKTNRNHINDISVFDPEPKQNTSMNKEI